LPAIELDGRSLSNSLVLLLYYSRCYRDYVRFQQVARPIAVTFDPHADELQYVGSANVRIGQDIFDHVLRYEEPFNPSPLHPRPGEQISQSPSTVIVTSIVPLVTAFTHYPA
jgi:hypothetical protein